MFQWKSFQVNEIVSLKPPSTSRRAAKKPNCQQADSGNNSPFNKGHSTNAAIHSLLDSVLPSGNEPPYCWVCFGAATCGMPNPSPAPLSAGFVMAMTTGAGSLPRLQTLIVCRRASRAWTRAPVYSQRFNRNDRMDINDSTYWNHRCRTKRTCSIASARIAAPTRPIRA